ncbi:hypothetical protein WICPIJ_003545 [Wickerhamomyces pijperi]|uniref:Mitochondrial fusion and transport protein UGO1 n=1 Tax=Wickerhamomyces pijperi TaxID=599730 RepID=A0A9P8Q7L4_WICPI|nr:hypothetical protein WICPIJ_003545 [Wickerhamomyces pijperi]
MSDLRPYHDPTSFSPTNPITYRPGIGVVDQQGNTIASKIANSSHSRRSISGLGLSSGPGSTRGSSMRNLIKINDYNEGLKRDVYSDLEFMEYFETGNIVELLKSMINSLVRGYSKCLIAQPFEVGRLLLQVGDFETKMGNLIKEQEERKRESGASEDEEEEELNYFESKDKDTEEPQYRKTRVIRAPSVSHKKSKPQATQKELKLTKKNTQSKYLTPVTLNTIDVISALLSSEGMRGLWRASNVTFVYGALSSTLEAWITGFISPFLQIPDPFFVDVVHSNDPLTTLLLSLSATVITGLLLAPLDLIRTRLIVTKIGSSERSIRKTISRLNYYTVPISLVVPVTMNTLASQVFKKVTPYLLFVHCGIDAIASPVTYSICSLLSSVMELFVKLPIETILRRAQVHYLVKDAEISSNALKIQDSDSKLVVKFAGYSGIFTTLYDAYFNKGENSGVEAIWRGWRVGLLNVVAEWGLGVIRSSEDVLNSQEEKF